jgi:hypothetical protein
MALMFPASVFASEEFGQIHDLSGSAQMRDSSSAERAVSVGQKVLVGETISTGAHSELHITSTDGGLIALRPNTIFRVDAYIAEHQSTDKVYMSLLKGSLRSITGRISRSHPEAYQVSTLTTTIGIRGTDHEVTIIEAGEEAGIHNAVLEGATVVRNSEGEVHVPAGHFAFAPHSGTSKPVLLDRKPKFHAGKFLHKIERKFEQRKLELEGRLKRMREEWAKSSKRESK